MAFDESLAARIREALARKRGVEDDDPLKAWVKRAVKFVKTLPKK